jgi:hypothetical protein
MKFGEFVTDGQWEEVSGNTDRLKVPHGWIVKTERQYVSGVSVHQIFIEDRDHLWKIEK